MDLLEIFNDAGITADHVTNLDINDLQSIGVSLDRAEQMHSDIKKENERKERLKREEDEEKKKMQMEEEERRRKEEEGRRRMQMEEDERQRQEDERKRQEDEERMRMQMEEEARKKALLNKLQYFKCVELYDDLVKIGYTSEKVFSIDHATLQNIGLSFMERKNVLTKIQSVKDAEIEGNILSAM